MKRIKIKISRTGETTILDAEGFGTSCNAATAAMERRLGKIDESSRAMTENYYVAPDEQSLTNTQE